MKKAVVYCLSITAAGAVMWLIWLQATFSPQVCVAADAKNWVKDARQRVFDSFAEVGHSEYFRMPNEKPRTLDEFLLLDTLSEAGAPFTFRFQRKDRPGLTYEITYYDNCVFNISNGHASDIWVPP
jgi:hypothetical protein